MVYMIVYKDNAEDHGNCPHYMKDCLVCNEFCKHPSEVYEADTECDALSMFNHDFPNNEILTIWQMI